MILDEENLEGEITGLGLANPGDGTTGERLGVFVFLADPMSNLLKSRSHGGLTTDALRMFSLELSTLVALDPCLSCFDFLWNDALILEMIWILATVQRLTEIPTLPKGYDKNSIITQSEPKAMFHNG